jgi:porin
MCTPLSKFMAFVAGAVCCAAAYGQTTQPSQQAATAPTTQPTTIYSGDIATRTTLTGDWGNERNKLADKGMTFDLDVTQISQGVVSGGRNDAWAYSGLADLNLNLDTGKAGLWPGGFLNVEAEGNWGSSVNRKTGAISPVNSMALYPTAGSDNFQLPSVSFAQYLSDHFGIFFGKVATVTSDSGDMNDFAHGKGDDNFMNLSFNFNPMLAIMPYSTLGAGIIILPESDPSDCVITLGAFDPNGEAGTSGFNTVGTDGTMFTGEARIKTNFFNLTGHQLVGGLYSDKLYTSLSQSLRFILVNRKLQSTSGASVFYYNFDQYVYENGKGSGQGVGVFGRFGVSDGNPNPIKYFYSVGLGGKGVIDSRPNDTCGIGYYYITTSNQIPSVLNLNDESGVEAYYDIAMTPWALLTPDIQYIDGSAPRTDPAVVLGLRLKLIF